MRPGVLDSMMEQEAPQAGYWQGGDKFRTRDGIAGLMAVIGDALSRQGGGQGGAVEMLGGGRMSALAMAQAAQAQQAKQQEDARILMRAGYSPEQAMAMASGNLKASDLKPDRMMTKTGDVLSFGVDGKPNTVYNESSPEILGVQGMGVYAMDRKTGMPVNAQQGGGTKPGPVEDGYQFIGGDDADPKNWRKVGGPTQPASGGFLSGR